MKYKENDLVTQNSETQGIKIVQVMSGGFSEIVLFMFGTWTMSLSADSWETESLDVNSSYTYYFMNKLLCMYLCVWVGMNDNMCEHRSVGMCTVCICVCSYAFVRMCVCMHICVRVCKRVCG